MKKSNRKNDNENFRFVEGGTKLTYRQVDHLLNNFIFTSHSIEKIKERKPSLYSENKSVMMRFVKGFIEREKTMCYMNTDLSINIEISKNKYFVFKYNKATYSYMLVTFKEKPLNNISAFKKFLQILKKA